MASDSNPATIANRAIRPVVSSTRLNDVNRVSITSREAARGRVRYSTMTITPDNTIAVSQATTAVQIAASASDPTIGTIHESVRSLLCTTMSGTTPMASTPTNPTRSGTVKLVTSPASMSGSRLRIAANSAARTARTRWRDGRTTVSLRRLG